MVLRSCCWANFPAIKGFLFIIDSFVWLCWQTIDLGELKGLRNLCAYIERVCVVIGIWVLFEAKVEPTLKDWSVFEETPGESKTGTAYHCKSLGHVIHPVCGVCPWLNHNS